MKFFEWQLVRFRVCCELKDLCRTSWRRKISAAVIGCAVGAKLLIWISLVLLELAPLFPGRLVAPSKLVYRFKPNKYKVLPSPSTFKPRLRIWVYLYQHLMLLLMRMLGQLQLDNCGLTFVFLSEHGNPITMDTARKINPRSYLIKRVFIMLRNKTLENRIL
jgi:hypothetical protein